MSRKIFYESFRMYQPVPMGKNRLNRHHFPSMDGDTPIFTIWREFESQNVPNDVIVVYEHATKLVHHMPLTNICFLIPQNQSVGEEVEIDESTPKRKIRPDRSERYARFAEKEDAAKDAL